MTKELKTLTVMWGAWVLAGIRVAPHRYNTDFVDTIALVFYGLGSLAVIGMTIRFLYRLVTSRDQAAQNQGHNPERANEGTFLR
ncbi:hypothetical protein [Streptomyces exfoliatus]|uniref:hypothetical protein n=1 Tax=Streptomyces exfoliatus TaxID=1905 RepID=UPI0004C536D5|nr:hypothetical protein [Streptomyces exfoliatus]